MKFISIFLSGIVKLIEPPSRYRRRFKKYSSPFSRDFKSLQSDWLAVGRDFRKVLVNYGKQ